MGVIENPVLTGFNGTFTHCPLLNMSECKFTEKHDSFVVTIYNPLSSIVSKYIRIPIVGGQFSVRDPKGE